MVLAIILFLIVWFGTGYLFWRAMHYGAIKYWHKRFNEDYSESASSKQWIKSKPIAIIVGLINLFILFIVDFNNNISFKHGITLNYKVPTGTPKCRF